MGGLAFFGVEIDTDANEVMHVTMDRRSCNEFVEWCRPGRT